MKRKKTLLHYVDRLFWGIAALAIVCMAVGSTTDIIRRWITGLSFPWMISFCETCMAVMVWACIMPTQRIKGHVNVTIFTGKMRPKTQKILAVFAALLGAAFFIIICIQAEKQGMWAFSRKMYRAGDYTRFPIWWAYLFVPIGGLAMIIQLLGEAAQGIIDLVKGNYISDLPEGAEDVIPNEALESDESADLGETSDSAKEEIP